MDHFKSQTQASAEGGKEKDGKEQEKSGEKPERMEDGDNVNPAEDYLRCVGDSVAAMLDPLGESFLLLLFSTVRIMHIYMCAK